MEVIYTLIPGMLFLGIISVVVLIFAIRKGQYDDLEGDANRILMEDEDEFLLDDHPKKAVKKDGKTKGNPKKFWRI